MPLFHAKTKRNYVFVSTYLVRMLETDAYDDVLKDAIIANSLVNTSRRLDSFFKTDRINELLNKYMRDIALGRRNGSFEVKKHLKKASLIADFYG